MKKLQNKTLDRYKKIFSEYIVEVISKENSENIYWKFPNNWGAWLYCTHNPVETYEINTDSAGYSFENWLSKSDIYPVMEIVPVRYPEKKDNKKTIERMRTSSKQESYVHASPDYDNQNVISFPFFDPEPINVINLLTKIKCLKNES